MAANLTVSQYFVSKRPIAWTLLVATAAWGIYAYNVMPQRREPQVQVRTGLVLTSYPGASAVEVEQELTRKIEKKLAENPSVEHVRSTSRQGLSVVFVDLYEATTDAEPIWQDLDNKLASMDDLPTSSGVVARPRLDKDFGETVALMLTISSPPVSDFEVERRAEVIARRLATARDARAPGLRDRRLSAVLVHPTSLDPGLVERVAQSTLRTLAEQGLAEDGQYLAMLGTGAIDFRLPPGTDEARVRRELGLWETGVVGPGFGHPDVWPVVVVGPPGDLAGELKRHCQQEPGGVARYTYEELRQFADMIQDRFRRSSRVGKIGQIGTLDETVYLYMSGRRLGSSGLDLPSLARRLAERNLDVPGGTFDLIDQSLTIKPTGKLGGQGDLGDIIIATRDSSPVYLRDFAEVVHGYEDPPRKLNFRTVKSPGNPATTTRAITLAVRQVKGTQVRDFSRDVDEALASLAGILPDDLQVERTNNEPEEVDRKIEEFIRCLIEAIVIVVIVALLFMEWRLAMLVALSIPITVAMTLGMCAMLGIDIQQVSIAALVIALGLLVDDPVVAGDAINRELAHGTPREIAAWLGPQKLARAIMYATVTNCIAFLPILLVHGNTGEYIYSLPVVVTASLVASRIVSMTFIPLLGYYLLRGQLGLEAGLHGTSWSAWFARQYNGFSELCIAHRWTTLGACLILVGTAASSILSVGTIFFPKDMFSVFTIDLFLPEGTPLRHTKTEALRAIDEIDHLIGEEVTSYTTFVGAGGPRFAFSIVPEQEAAAYAQVMVHSRDRRRTAALADRLQRELPPRIAAARVQINQIATGPPIGVPVQVRVTGTDITTLRHLGDQVKEWLRALPGTINVHDNWDPEILQLGLKVDSERANLAGVTNRDVASLVNGAISGVSATSIRKRDRLIPVVLRFRPDERIQLEEQRTLSLPTGDGTARVPLNQIAVFQPEPVAPKIARRDHERCLTVKCDTATGVLPSRVVDYLETNLAKASKSWPVGYHYSFGGENEEQAKGFASMHIAIITSLVAIYLALVVQFNSLAKPMIVCAAVPFGMVGGLVGLALFDVPLGFMAMLGLSSLSGVIISHIIVLFDYIEDAQERGEPLRRAVIDAALVRLRPVLVTVLATVGGLIPLARRGGPLWEPLCYVQIVGLLAATVVTKVLVPVLYVLFVENFRLIRWSPPREHAQEGSPTESDDVHRTNTPDRHFDGAQGAGNRRWN